MMRFRAHYFVIGLAVSAADPAKAFQPQCL